MRRVAATLVVLALLAPGCARVAAYERETLARRDMQLTRDGNLTFGEDHARAYREGAVGGAAEVAGGGCGCN